MTHRQPFHQNLKTPIPNKTTESYGQKIESYVSVPIKEEFNKWLNDTFKPTYFLTVQLPDNKKSANLDNAKEHLRNIMKAFEKSLMNNWNKHHVLPQVCQAAKLRVLKLKLFQISSAFAGVMYPSLECK